MALSSINQETSNLGSVKQSFKINEFWPAIWQTISKNLISGIVGPPGTGKSLRLPILLTQVSTGNIWLGVFDKETVEQSLSCLQQDSNRNRISVMSLEDVKLGLLNRTLSFNSNDIVILDDSQDRSDLTEAIYNLWTVFEVGAKLVLVGTQIDTTIFNIPIYQFTIPSHPCCVIFQSQNYTLSDPTRLIQTVRVLQDWLFGSATGNCAILTPNSLTSKLIREQVELLLDEFPQIQTSVQLNPTCSLTGNPTISPPRQIYVLDTPKGQKFENVNFIIDMMIKETHKSTPLGGVRTRLTSISKNEAYDRAESILAQTKVKTCFRMCTKQFYDALPDFNTYNQFPSERLVYEAVLYGIPVLDMYPHLNRGQTTQTVLSLTRLGFIPIETVSPILRDLALTLSLPFKMVKVLFDWIQDGGDAFLMLTVLQLIDSFETSLFKPAPALFDSAGENEMYYFQHFKQFFSSFTGSSTLSTLVGLSRAFFEQVGLGGTDEQVREWARTRSIDENVFVLFVSDFQRSWKTVKEIYSDLDPDFDRIAPEYFTDAFVNESVGPRLAQVYPERVVVRQKSDLTRVLYTRGVDVFSIDIETVPVSEDGIMYPPWYLNLIQRTLMLPGNVVQQVVVGIGLDELPELKDVGDDGVDVSGLVEGEVVF